MLRSFDLENNHENLDKKIIFLITSINQLYGYQAIRRRYHTTLQATPNTMSTCVWQRYDQQYYLQSQLGSNKKEKTGNYKKVQSKIKQEQELNSL
jgi:hypothetical protein